MIKIASRWTSVSRGENTRFVKAEASTSSNDTDHEWTILDRLQHIVDAFDPLIVLSFRYLGIALIPAATVAPLVRVRIVRLRTRVTLRPIPVVFHQAAVAAVAFEHSHAVDAFLLRKGGLEPSLSGWTTWPP